MFAIVLIHCTGGTKTILAESIKECREQCKSVCAAYPKNYVASTIPFATYKENKTGLYNTSVPFEIKKELGMELRLMLDQSMEE